MTEQQRQFAAEHHSLIYAFLREKGWPASEYYDIAAFGFLRAVCRYLTDPALGKFSFTTIAWRAMGQSISSFRRTETRRKDAERRYIETVREEAPDPYAELEQRMLLHDLAAVSSEQQYRLASLRLQGYSITEAARAQGMSAWRVRRLLRELYQIYFTLYHNEGSENNE